MFRDSSTFHTTGNGGEKRLTGTDAGYRDRSERRTNCVSTFTWAHENFEQKSTRRTFPIAHDNLGPPPRQTENAGCKVVLAQLKQRAGYGKTNVVS